MRPGVLGHLEQRPKEVVHDLSKALHQFVAFVNVKEPGDLNQPADIVRIDIVVQSPFGQFVPLVGAAPVDGQPQLEVLVLGLFEVEHDLLDEFAKEAASDEVVGLHKDFTKAGLSYGVVFGVELVKSVKCVAVLNENCDMKSPRKCLEDQ